VLIFPESSKNVAKYFHLVISGIKKILYTFFSNGSRKLLVLRQIQWVGRKGETNNILIETQYNLSKVSQPMYFYAPVSKDGGI
jgi:hypothetical protein